MARPSTGRRSGGLHAHVTSKENGSGWGLTLVRNILLQYAASIDLIEHRRGVSVRTTLPRTLRLDEG